jgi:hypothetical protein
MLLALKALVRKRALGVELLWCATCCDTTCCVVVCHAGECDPHRPQIRDLDAAAVTQRR